MNKGDPKNVSNPEDRESAKDLSGKQDVQRKKKKRMLGGVFHNPAFIGGSHLIAVLSLCFTFYAYLTPIEKELAVTVEHRRVLDFEAIEGTFEVSHKVSNGFFEASDPDQTDVYETVFDIWNVGPHPIDKDDVRHPLTLAFRDGQIFNVEIVKQSLPKISQFRLIPLAGQSSAGEISVGSEFASLEWETFERDFGLRIRVLHSPPAPKSFDLDIFISNGSLTHVERKKQKWFQPVGAVFVGSLLIVVLLLVIIGNLEKRMTYFLRKASNFVCYVSVCTFVVSTLCIAFFTIYFLFVYSKPTILS